MVKATAAVAADVAAAAAAAFIAVENIFLHQTWVAGSKVHILLLRYFWSFLIFFIPGNV